MFYPIVLAGGIGSRLWPLSRMHYPKQFLPLLDEKTLLEQTIERIDGLDYGAGAVICNEVHRFLAAEQLRRSAAERMHLILEPEARGTAPAIALAALEAMSHGDNPLLLVMPADHYIADAKNFQATILRGRQFAEQGYLVTFGIEPTRAETGYGYIKRGAHLDDAAFTVAAFKEKPDADTAQSLFSDGQHYWNGGLFLFSANTYIDALSRYCPNVLASCRQAMEEATREMDFIRPEPGAFARCSDESIDYAVMERTDAAVVVPLEVGWSDVGSWRALWDLHAKDADGNAARGDVLLENCRNTYVHAGDRLVSVLGLDDLIVVDTQDAVLVAHKEAAPDIGRLVKRLRHQKRIEVDVHRTVYRPWGHYDSVDCGTRHQVKRITVKPGAKLSVQMHHHRAEHWVVVSGTARVSRGGDTFLVSENESTYIPVGCIHALENPGSIDLQLIEVQSGSYLGEDDIVRLEDRYGRR